MPSQFIDWAALAAAVIAFAALWHLKRTRTAGFGLRVIIATVLGIALGLVAQGHTQYVGRRDLVAGHRRARRAAAAVQRVLQRHQPRRLTAAARHGGQDRRVPAAQHAHRIAAHPWSGQRFPHRRRLPVLDAHRLPATRGARGHRHDHQPVPLESDGELVGQPGRAGGAVLAARRHRVHGRGLHRLRTRDGQTVQGRHRRRRRRTLQGHADHRRFHPVRRALPDRLRGRR